MLGLFFISSKAMALGKWEAGEIRQMRRSLLEWYRQQGRQLPWRNEPDIYRVWISEIMLQQTQVKTVMPYYERWLERFPTVSVLADADLQAVLKLWEGLGYYARARNLHHAAQQVRDDFGGVFPATFPEVLSLKGIGRTTAGGILSSARNLAFPILDGNVKRVLARLVALPQPPAKAIAPLWELSELLLDPLAPGDFNQALMDLGATLCSARRPDCLRCPWQGFCQAHLTQQPGDYPQKVPKKSIPTKLVTVAIAFNGDTAVFIQQRPSEGLLGGLWEFPHDESDGQAILKQLFPKAIYVKTLPTIYHAYSHFKLEITPKIYQVSLSGPGWVQRSDLHQYPFSKAHLKIIEQLKNTPKL